MKRLLLILCCLFLIAGTGIMLVSAHSVPSPALQNGTCTFACVPTPTSPPSSGGNGNHNPGDPDGDGIPNGIDQCPDEGGPSSNQGCPVGRNLSAVANNPEVVLATPAIQNIILPILSTDHSVCQIATHTGTPVNVRAQPSIHAQIVGTLDPHTIYWPADALILVDGSRWIQITQPWWGWVSANVVRQSEGCPYTLPTYKQRPNPPKLSPLSYTNEPMITLDKSDNAGSDNPNGYCAPTFGINIGSANGLNQAIHFTFGDGSVTPHPAQGCFKLDADGHGFGIEPLTELAAQPFSLHFSVGFSPDNPNALMLIGLLQPPSDPSAPSSDTDKLSIPFTWDFLPPDPCKPGASSCSGGVRNFTINFSQPNVADPGVAFSWNIVPPDPCKVDGKSCPEGSGKQAVLLNFVPPGPCKTGDQSCPSGARSEESVMVALFPNGFDPSIGGFTQIENQPNGSSPGDQYGFTQIENQPLREQFGIDFELPAVQSS